MINAVRIHFHVHQTAACKTTFKSTNLGIFIRHFPILLNRIRVVDQLAKLATNKRRILFILFCVRDY